jgi:hypothetical protein
MGMRYVPPGNEEGLSCLKWNVYLEEIDLPEAAAVPEINVQILVFVSKLISRIRKIRKRHLHWHMQICTQSTYRPMIW